MQGAQFLDAADQSWQAQLDPDPSRYRLGLEALEACVRDGGPAEIVPVPSGLFYALSRTMPSREIVVSAAEVETYQQCALEFEAETGFLGPGPTVRK